MKELNIKCSAQRHDHQSMVHSITTDLKIQKDRQIIPFSHKALKGQRKWSQTLLNLFFFPLFISILSLIWLS